MTTNEVILLLDRIEQCALNGSEAALDLLLRSVDALRNQLQTPPTMTPVERARMALEAAIVRNGSMVFGRGAIIPTAEIDAYEDAIRKENE